jgi:ribose-phosphate pyrophosphokinase
MIVTGGTLIAAADALKKAGAVSVHVFATHGHFAGNAMKKLAGADLAEIVVTDTVPIDPLNEPDTSTVLPISGLLAETILSVFTDSSVSAIFAGENQLF